METGETEGSLDSRGAQTFGVSGPHWKKKRCLELHIKYTNTNENKKSHTVLSKFTVVCWATFTAILGHAQPMGHRSDTPGRVELIGVYQMLISWF